MFRKKILIILTVVILFGAGLAQAVENWDIYSDAVIEEGDEYNIVIVHDTPPDHTTVDMTGGIVTSLGAYDSSTVNVSGGVLLSGLGGYNSSTLNLSGDMQTHWLWVRESAFSNTFGGSVDFLETTGSGTVNLHGGTTSGYLKAVDSSLINIYGYGFEYNPSAGSYGGGQLTGFWVDSTPFSMDLFASDEPGGAPIDTYSHIVLIPEPATILLFGLGALVLKARI